VPLALDGPLFTLFGTQFPAYRAFMMGVSLLMLLALWGLLTRTRVGLVIQAALTHPDMVQALGHNVPRVFTGVFAAGCALAGLAGVLGGAAFVTEPAMAASIGGLVFVVVVVGGMGSLAGAFWASMLLGLIQTFAVASDVSLMSLASGMGWQLDDSSSGLGLWAIKLSQLAPVLPYLLMVVTLILRPRGLLGSRSE
jgi:branched-chain amino acid transport system permease protein